jgi:hypothetical protein
MNRKTSALMDDIVVIPAHAGMIRSIVEPTVEAVHNHQHAVLARRGAMGVDPFARLHKIEPVCLHGHEICRGIAGRALRPLHVADLAHAVGRNKYNDIGEGQSASALTRVQLPLRREGGGGL